MDAYEQAKQRLRNHAGLPTGGQGARDEDSLQYALWLAGRKKSPPHLALLDDVIECLLVLNNHFNGPDADHASGPRQEPIPDDISYSVACIMSMCLSCYRNWSVGHLFPDDALSALLVGAHRIAYCWEGVLAGDMSDPLAGFDLPE